MTHRYIVIGPNGPLPWTVAQSPERTVDLFLPGLPRLWEGATREGYRVDPLNRPLIAVAQPDRSQMHADCVLS